MGDYAAKTFRIKIALPEDTPLKPGMSVEANIITREKPNALLIPADALHDNAVFVVDGSRVRKRAVKIGIRGTRGRGCPGSRRRARRSPAPTVTDGARVRVVKAAAPEASISARPRASGDPGRIRRLVDFALGSRLRGNERTFAPRSGTEVDEPDARHRLDPCARARAPDRLRGRRRGHRRRLLDHDGRADGGLAGRFHPAHGQHPAAHHRLRRTPHAAACSRRRSCSTPPKSTT